MKELDAIVKTKAQILEELYGITIENNMIERIDMINCIGPFGNTVSFEIFCVNDAPYPHYDNTANGAYVFVIFVKMFDLEREDGIRLTDVKNVPCRIVYDDGRAVGIGHFMKDRFVLMSDLLQIGRETGVE